MIKKLKSLNHLMLIILVGIIISSCNEEGTSSNSTIKSKAIQLAMAISGTTGNKYADDFLAKYDNNNLIGVIALEHKHYNYYNFTYSVNEYSQSNYGIFVDNNRTHQIPIKNDISINQSPMIFEYGQYVSSGEYPVALNFPGTNKIYITGTGVLPEDSIIVNTVSSPITITNLTLNQNVSKSQNLVVNWTGGKVGELAQLNFSMSPDTIAIAPNTKVATYVSNSNSNHTLTISSTELQQLPNGDYTINLYTYEPTYKTLSNGKQILAVSVFAYQLEVKLVN